MEKERLFDVIVRNEDTLLVPEIFMDFDESTKLMIKRNVMEGFPKEWFIRLKKGEINKEEGYFYLTKLGFEVNKSLLKKLFKEKNRDWNNFVKFAEEFWTKTNTNNLKGGDKEMKEVKVTVECKGCPFLRKQEEEKEKEKRVREAWEKRKELRIEAEKLYAKGNELHAKGSSFNIETCKSSTEGWRLHSHGGEYIAKGNELSAHGNIILFESILKEYGNIGVEWKSTDELHLENGVVLK